MTTHAPTAAPTVIAERRGHVGVLTLHRASALNALSLDMIRALTAALLDWQGDEAVSAVVLRGANRPGKAPAFCAGGDIRFFHQAALAGDPRLEDFFTEEYALNHLIHHYRKPLIALMDGVTMGGGMGISQGAALRVVTEHSLLAMPETNIGLFPDVGGGWFLARCAGHLGEFLGLSGQVLHAADALAVGWADLEVPAARLDEMLDAIVATTGEDGSEALATARDFGLLYDDPLARAPLAAEFELIHRVFSRDSLVDILSALADEPGEFARTQLAVLQKRSPLMMAVTLELIRRARHLSLAEDLRMERDLVRHAFHLRPGTASETVEGIRALVVDKDHQPRWNPSHVEDVDQAMVAAFFQSPWPATAHPLRALD